MRRPRSRTWSSRSRTSAPLSGRPVSRGTPSSASRETATTADAVPGTSRRKECSGAGRGAPVLKGALVWEPVMPGGAGKVPASATRPWTSKSRGTTAPIPSGPQRRSTNACSGTSPSSPPATTTARAKGPFAAPHETSSSSRARPGRGLAIESWPGSLSATPSAHVRRRRAPDRAVASSWSHGGHEARLAARPSLPANALAPFRPSRGAGAR